MFVGVFGASSGARGGFALLAMSREEAGFARSAAVVDPARLAPNHVARLSALCGAHMESEVGIVVRRVVCLRNVFCR